MEHDNSVLAKQIIKKIQNIGVASEKIRAFWDDTPEQFDNLSKHNMWFTHPDETIDEKLYECRLRMMAYEDLITNVLGVLDEDFDEGI